MLDEISCAKCENRVLVEKYSPEHTSVQWIRDSATACKEFASRTSDQQQLTLRTCRALRDTINDLTDRGRIPMSTRSYPTPGQLH